MKLIYLTTLQKSIRFSIGLSLKSERQQRKIYGVETRPVRKSNEDYRMRFVSGIMVKGKRNTLSPQRKCEDL